MEKTTNGWTLGELATLLGGQLAGPADLRLTGPALSDADDPHGLAFAETEEYVQKASSSGVGAILVPLNATELTKPSIRVEKPRQAFAKFLAMCQKPLPIQPGVDHRAAIDPTAEISPNASIGPYVVIAAGVRIAAGAKIYPFAYVGEDCVLGENVVIYPQAVLYRDVEIGSGSVVHAGAVLGADGFGFTWNGSEQVKIPQVGKTRIGRNVEIGACTTIDRAMLGVTEIQDGTKIDNLVQIGHNTNIGKHTILAAQAGISGSTTIGDRCVFAGQTATVDHVRITNDVTLTGRAAVSKDIETPGPYRGAPATPYSEQLRLEAAQRKLPEMLKRLRELEAKVLALEKNS